MSNCLISTAIVIVTAPSGMTAIGGKMPPGGIMVVSESAGWAVRVSTGAQQIQPKSRRS